MKTNKEKDLEEQVEEKIEELHLGSDLWEVSTICDKINEIIAVLNKE